MYTHTYTHIHTRTSLLGTPTVDGRREPSMRARTRDTHILIHIHAHVHIYTHTCNTHTHTRTYTYTYKYTYICTLRYAYRPFGDCHRRRKARAKHACAYSKTATPKQTTESHPYRAISAQKTHAKNGGIDGGHDPATIRSHRSRRTES